MLQAGADLEAKNKWKNTPLHFAARWSSHDPAVMLLLKAGADPMARDKWRHTPLHLAAGNNKNPAAIEALLKDGADLDARDDDKETPLHWAARSNENPAVIEALLQAGADLMALNKDLKTPFEVAGKGQKKILDAARRRLPEQQSNAARARSQKQIKAPAGAASPEPATGALGVAGGGTLPHSGISQTARGRQESWSALVSGKRRHAGAGLCAAGRRGAVRDLFRQLVHAGTDRVGATGNQGGLRQTGRLGRRELPVPAGPAAMKLRPPPDFR